MKQGGGAVTPYPPVMACGFVAHFGPAGIPPGRA